MKIPKNMTEDQVINQILKVVDKIAPKYAFQGYEVDDIKQEAFIICIEALERYDENRPLENFLSVNLSNRLKNFVRDNYSFSNNQERRNVLSPIQLSYEENIIDKNLHDKISAADLEDLILDKLPAKYRADYLKYTQDVAIPKKNKEELFDVLRRILEENDYA